MENFIEVLKDLVLKSGLSLRQLENKSGVNAIQYSRYLNGGTPTLNITLKIAKYFNVSLDYLFGLNENNKKYNSYNYDMSTFIERYEALLKENKLSHFKFAKNNAMNESILRHWKSGKIPRLDNLYLIAYQLGSSIDFLIGRK